MNVVVIGGGPAGLMASIVARKNNYDVILLEKNEKLGKKLYITGKGRCNITNLVPCDEFLQNVVNNNKFLYSALQNFSSYDTVNFLEENGLKTKTERGNRVFPNSDKASDVTKTFEKVAKSLGVKIQLKTNVNDIEKTKNDTYIIYTNNGKFLADKVIIATGGISYQSTGSTGDGYIFAKKLGHSVSKLYPALVGIKTDIKIFAGISLKNIKLKIFDDKNNLVCSQFGEMLFTHTGISGPIVLTISSMINKFNLNGWYAELDYKPALSEEKLNERLLRDFNKYKNKDYINYLPKLLPSGIVNEFALRTKIDLHKKINEITKQDRINIINQLKKFKIKIYGLEDIESAIVTCGGVNVKEINPKTMESKISKNCYFAGEVVDVDALTGGFNIQIALSTGALAGKLL